jgi:hypothetical protein
LLVVEAEVALTLVGEAVQGAIELTLELQEVVLGFLPLLGFNYKLTTW